MKPARVIGACALLSLVWPVNARAAYRDARIRHVEPQVLVQRATEASTEEAIRNLPFLPGDRVCQYKKKKLSDQSITIGAIWLVYGVAQSIDLMLENTAWFFAGIPAFARFYNHCMDRVLDVSAWATLDPEESHASSASRFFVGKTQ